MLKRTLLLLLGTSLVIAMACGGGDKKDNRADGDSNAPAGTSVASEDTDPTAEPDATEEATSGGDDDSDAGTSAFSRIFESAFGAGTGGPGGAGLGGGDQALLDYVLTAADFPDGYSSLGEFTFRAPDGVSEGGGADMAASMAASGDFTSGDISDVSMIMSMVMRFDDLTELGDALDELDDLSEDDLRDAITSGGEELPMGIKFTNIELLDADGLGEGAAGIGMTIDMGDLAETLGGVGGAEDFPTQMTMRMYFFGRGDYMGAIMHMGFGVGLPSVDELALARALDANLQAAP